jgi:hypothetical protein
LDLEQDPIMGTGKAGLSDCSGRSSALTIKLVLGVPKKRNSSRLSSG